jgi:hypothetical protein
VRRSQALYCRNDKMLLLDGLGCVSATHHGRIIICKHQRMQARIIELSVLRCLKVIHIEILRNSSGIYFSILYIMSCHNNLFCNHTEFGSERISTDYLFTSVMCEYKMYRGVTLEIFKTSMVVTCTSSKQFEI